MFDPYIAPNLDDWDSCIFQAFFSKEQAHSTVLCVDEEVLNELAPGHGIRALVDAVEDECTVHRLRNRNPIFVGVDRWRMWQLQGAQSPPPTLGILALLVAAASHRDDAFPPHAYWQRLQDLRERFCPDAEKISEAHRNLIETLFRNLAHWSVVDQNSIHGTFELRRVGGMRRIGLVRAQSLLSYSERHNLEEAFCEFELHPDRPTSRAELVQVARSVEGELRPATRKLLAAWPNDGNAEALVQLIDDHLRDWDGTTVDQQGRRVARPIVLPAVIEMHSPRLGPFRAVLRVESGRSEVADETQLRADDGTACSLRFEFGSLSEPVSRLMDDEPFDLTTRDWGQSLRFHVEGGSADTVNAVLLPAREVRFFARVDTRTWRERCMAPTAEACIIACASEIANPVAEWLQRYAPAGQFRELNDHPAPSAWRMFRVDSIPEDSEARRGFPVQGRIELIDGSFKLIGGIRDSGGRFFPFALPHLEVLSTSTDVHVQIAESFDIHGQKIDGVRLHRVEEGPRRTRYHLDAPEPLWTRLACVRVDLVDSGEVADSRTILTSAATPPLDACHYSRDRWGRPVVEDACPIFRATGIRAIVEDDLAAIDPTAPLGQPDPITLTEPSDADLFVQVLAARESLAWPTAKRLAAELVRSIGEDDGSWRMARAIVFQFEAMRALGYLEIEEDDGGHFSTVRALPPCLHVLPTRSNLGIASLPPSSNCLIQAVAAGTWNRRQLAELIANARRANLLFHITQQASGYWIVPDRVAVLASDLDELRGFAEAHSLAMQEVTFAQRTTEHLRPPEEYVEDAGWRAGPPPHRAGRRAFDVSAMRSRPEEDVTGDLILCECRDPLSDRLWSYWLHERSANRSAQCPRQIGRWVVARLHPQGPLALPRSSQGDVYVPLELRPPLMVERMMCACSGLAPEIIVFRRGTSVRWADVRIAPPPEEIAEWLTGAHRRSGHWLRYGRVANSPLVEATGQTEFLGSLGLPLASVPILTTGPLEI